ncbi:hypothetical protein ATANTOWER_001735 [Ataeniobius toweri]|uniref:Uncharacterized protein n=1 Tax=Ataeniobius toweri TaxID=208326 RepID=A0ABU7BE45_9TELE|nr:hypothetical protein [Ataeniobius toweri]
MDQNQYLPARYSKICSLQYVSLSSQLSSCLQMVHLRLTSQQSEEAEFPLNLFGLHIIPGSPPAYSPPSGWKQRKV